MIYSLAIAGLIGLCLGSFSVTAALRTVKGEQVLAGRSHCDHCDVALDFAGTAPVWSYLSRKGRCDACGGAIDPAHLVGELCGAALVVTALDLEPNWRGGLVALLGLVLLASGVTDARSRRLPDGLTLAAAVICIILSATQSLESLTEGLAAAGAAFAVLQGLRWGFAHWRGRQALGFGDVKLIAALALWIGLSTPWAITGAALLGLASMVVVRPADGRLAFGPAIALAAWLTGLAGEIHLVPVLT